MTRKRDEAAVLIELGRQHYIAVRPRSGLGYRTPHEYKAILGQPESVTLNACGPAHDGRADGAVFRLGKSNPLLKG